MHVHSSRSLHHFSEVLSHTDLPSRAKEKWSCTWQQTPSQKFNNIYSYGHVRNYRLQSGAPEVTGERTINTKLSLRAQYCIVKVFFASGFRDTALQPSQWYKNLQWQQWHRITLLATCSSFYFASSCSSLVLQPPPPAWVSIETRWTGSSASSGGIQAAAEILSVEPLL